MSGDSATRDPNADEPIGLAEAYSVQSPDDNRALYAKWAETYESEFTVPRRYIVPRTAAEMLCEGFAGSGPVLDAGCGTGLVGEQLRQLGVAVVDGFDISTGMLAQARAKTAADGSPVYRVTVEVDLTGPIDVADDTYAAIISTGMFTHGHVGPDSIAELLRIARPGAFCVMGVNASIFESNGFRDRFELYEAEGLIAGLEVQHRQVYEGADGSDLNHMAQIAAFTVV
ncbi:MAG: methyltransferase domain-containing protein [Acidimicrobiaceae bacterium]|nr:methyltransferase domain-containing protein [Acidimicrobiaceae bacterium]MXW77193.1 methyltransferase domain-containing protein [Acidimicrobiaceae bacterium]MYD06516.1 methyltransferase domain-containing protein [Acidimicrobiaceae bacterium]MYI57181.1 methyltransferase domain-containing protein [Acidimicrobiaceae bacterium]